MPRFVIEKQSLLFLSKPFHSSYACVGALDKAAKHYEHSFANSTRHFGASSAHAAATINNIGCLSFEQRDFNSAQVHVSQALDLHKSIFGLAHSQTARTIMNLAAIEYTMDGDVPKCRRSMDWVFATLCENLGASHPFTVRALQWQTHLQN
jgi:hypothetical protein